MIKDKKSPGERLEKLDNFAMSFEAAVLDLMIQYQNGDLTETRFEEKVYELECWLHDMG